MCQILWFFLLDNDSNEPRTVARMQTCNSHKVAVFLVCLSHPIEFLFFLSFWVTFCVPHSFPHSFPHSWRCCLDFPHSFSHSCVCRFCRHVFYAFFNIFWCAFAFVCNCWRVVCVVVRRSWGSGDEHFFVVKILGFRAMNFFFSFFFP